jgi:hypothetical protein
MFSVVFLSPFSIWSKSMIPFISILAFNSLFSLFGIPTPKKKTGNLTDMYFSGSLAKDCNLLSSNFLSSIRLVTLMKSPFSLSLRNLNILSSLPLSFLLRVVGKWLPTLLCMVSCVF